MNVKSRAVQLIGSAKLSRVHVPIRHNAFLEVFDAGSESGSPLPLGRHRLECTSATSLTHLGTSLWYSPQPIRHHVSVDTKRTEQRPVQARLPKVRPHALPFKLPRPIN